MGLRPINRDEVALSWGNPNRPGGDFNGVARNLNIVARRLPARFCLSLSFADWFNPPAYISVVAAAESGLPIGATSSSLT